MHTPHILIIDDSEDILRLLEILFITEGYEVTTCVDGDQGISAYKKGDIDVVVTDFLMPKIDGLDVLSAIRKSNNPAPVILITGHASVEKAVEAMKGGAFDFLTKPVNNDQLLITVKKALETRALILENQRLKKELSTQYGFENIITDHPAMQSIFDTLRSVVETDVTVLLTGESGTGKELIARSIHYQSKRQPNPFVAVNCAAIPATLLESEFFGHEKGSFTGAISRREGKFESAHGGTLLLDEIGDMSLELQAKLLRVIEKQEFERVGGNKTIHCDVRIIASTNRDLSKAVEEKQFRQDLYYRLNVVVIHLPPLRERKSDIILLADHFLTQFAEKYNKPKLKLSPEAVTLLDNYSWPGNVRELENYMERLAVTVHADTLQPEHLAAEIQAPQKEFPSTVQGKNQMRDLRTLPEKVSDLEIQNIKEALTEFKGKQSRASKKLGITERILAYKIRQYNIDLSEFRNKME